LALSSYAPRLRTALVLCGSGTAGAYHAGVLRALTDAGVKIDLVAAHGAGVIGALSGAADGGLDLSSPGGPWLSPRIKRAYRWRLSLRIAGWGMLVAVGLLLVPLAVLLLASLVYIAGMVATLANFATIGDSLIAWYRQTLERLFAPEMLPTIVPRAVLLAVLIVATVLIVSALRARRGERSRRRAKGAVWWRLLGQPLDPSEPEGVIKDVLGRITRGASTSGKDDPGRRYVELIMENFGQPGFREVMCAVHDLDARRDLIAAILAPEWRHSFAQRRVGAGPREAEMFDLVDGRDQDRGLVMDFVAGGLRLPVASAPHEVTFPHNGYWQGETHRWCDRPELVSRLIDEVGRVGVEQVILVSPAPPASTPHDMRSKALDFRTKMGETLRSVETAAFQDAWALAANRFSGVFAIRPSHNPIGPFDVDGVYDESSDRQRTLPELMQLGHDDAYRQFIEPVVAAGERLTEV
jgi:hypothetical protein